MVDVRRDYLALQRKLRTAMITRGITIERRYNPDQLRSPGGEHGGQWISSPESAVKAAAADALKLTGKVDLGPDERLVSSAKLDGAAGGVRLALIEHDGRRSLRIGLGAEGYGKPSRTERIPVWDGNRSRAPLSAADRKRLDGEIDSLDAEYDAASDARREQIDARLDEIHEHLEADDRGFNGTAVLDEYGSRRLADRLRPALDEAVEQEKVQNKAWDELEALEAKGNADPERLAALKEKARVDDDRGIIFTQGIVPGSDWGDVHYSVELDDITVGPTVRLGVQPKGAPDDWGDDRDWQGTFTVPEAKKFLKQLDKMNSTG